MGLELRQCFLAPKSNISQGLYFTVLTDSADRRRGQTETERHRGIWDITYANIYLLHFGNEREMAFNRVCAAVPDLRCQSEGDNEEEKAFGNFLADIESVDLPPGNTLRYL